MCTLACGVKSTSQLTAGSSQGADSTRVTNPDKVWRSLSASQRNTSMKHVSLQHRCHSVLTFHKAVQFARAILAKNKGTDAGMPDTAQCDSLGRLTGISAGDWHVKCTWSINAHWFPFSVLTLLWKEIKLTRLLLTGMFAASQVITYKSKSALKHNNITIKWDKRTSLAFTHYKYCSCCLLFGLYPVDPCGKKKVGVELHELLGAVGHEYRLNSCAPNTGYSDKQGAQ